MVELESWGAAVKRGLLHGFLLVPMPYLRRAPRWPRTAVPEIRALRAYSIAQGVALFAILLILAFIGGERTLEPSWEVGFWLAMTASAVAILAWVRVSVAGRVVTSSSPDEAVVAYRQRFYLMVAMASVPALVAFVLVFVANTLVLYVITLPLSLALIAYGSPRRGDVRRLQETIDDRGGTVDLATALMANQTGPS